MDEVVGVRKINPSRKAGTLIIQQKTDMFFILHGITRLLGK